MNIPHSEPNWRPTQMIFRGSKRLKEERGLSILGGQHTTPVHAPISEGLRGFGFLTCEMGVELPPRGLQLEQIIGWCYSTQHPFLPGLSLQGMEASIIMKEISIFRGYRELLHSCIINT